MCGHTNIDHKESIRKEYLLKFIFSFLIYINEVALCKLSDPICPKPLNYLAKKTISDNSNINLLSTKKTSWVCIIIYLLYLQELCHENSANI